jgi:hypothetical protein
MVLIAITIIVVSLLSNEIGFVLGDIGTATSYEPPYLREQILLFSLYYCCLQVSSSNLVFLNYGFMLIFVQLLSVMGIDKINSHQGTCLFL